MKNIFMNKDICKHITVYIEGNDQKEGEGQDNKKLRE